MATHSTLPAGSDPGHDSSLPLPPALLRELLQALRLIRYGTIELVIHDGRVVQLERREKVRFEHEVTDSRR
jgi:hypothetical protein